MNEDTQKLPRIEKGMESDVDKKRILQDDETVIQPPFSQQPKDGARPAVRRLTPLDAQKGPYPDAKKKENWFKRHKKAVILTGGFLAALMLGMIVAGWQADKRDLANSQRQVAELQQKNQQEKAARSQAELKQQKAELEAKLAELEKQQKALEGQSSRLQGRNDQIQDDASESTVGKLIDKVTGKDKKRQAQVNANNEKASAADQQASSVQQSIAQVQSMIDDVDSQMGNAGSVKDQAAAVAQQAQKAYHENEGMIQQVLGYAKKGAGMLLNLFE